MTGASRDLTGRRFGKLTALEPTDERKNGYILWRCRCDCGNELLVASRALKNGWTTDCGCSPKAVRHADLTGKRFGKLTVLQEVFCQERAGRVYWKCRCDCGGETVTTSGQLLSGYKKSCGCLSHPPLKDWVGKQFGLLEVTGYAGKRGGRHYWHCKCHCGCNREFDVCQSSLQSGHTKGCGSQNWNLLPDMIGKVFGDLTVVSYAGKKNGIHFWQCRCACGNETTVSQTNLVSGHTLSCGCRAKPSRTLHFIDGTCLESIRSKKIIASNTSGYTGVYLNRKSGRWAAQITFKGKTYYLGSYADKKEAIRARKRGEEMHNDFLKWYYANYPRTEKEKSEKDQAAAPA